MATRKQEHQENDGDGSVKATALRKYLTLAAIKLLKRVRPRFSSVLMLTPGICVKYGPFQHLSSAAAMQFISDNTTIPVPKVYCAFERNGVTYTVMSRTKGSDIGYKWHSRSESSKRELLGQLKAYVDEMRCLRPAEEGVVRAADGGKLHDVRLPNGVAGFGPFSSVDAFHEFLRDGIASSPDQLSEVNELIEKQTTTKYNVRFTHGDLSSLNVLVRGDSIVGIVDWDTAGWYPEYWEYTTAYNVNPYNGFWRSEVPKFLDDYPDALEMERLRQKHFGAF